MFKDNQIELKNCCYRKSIGQFERNFSFKTKSKLTQIISISNTEIRVAETLDCLRYYLQIKVKAYNCLFVYVHNL